MSVEIVRAERLRIPHYLNSDRVAKLKIFKTRITEWASPSNLVYETPVIVTVSYPRERLVAGRKVVWQEEQSKDHLHPGVIQFDDLISQKKGAGYKVSARDAVLAYALVFRWLRKSIVTGFLRQRWADTREPVFPEWADVKSDTVGEALSRLKTEGFLTVVTVPPAKPLPIPYYIPRPPEESLYFMPETIAEKLLVKGKWWLR